MLPGYHQNLVWVIQSMQLPGNDSNHSCSTRNQSYQGWGHVWHVMIVRVLRYPLSATSNSSTLTPRKNLLETLSLSGGLELSLEKHAHDSMLSQGR